MNVVRCSQKNYPANDGGHPTAKPAYLPHIEPSVVALPPERMQQKTRFRGLSAFSYGGLSRNRTGVHGFAIRCITTLPSGQQLVGKTVTYQAMSLHAGHCIDLERETRLELATSTLARLRSTN